MIFNKAKAITKNIETQLSENEAGFEKDGVSVSQKGGKITVTAEKAAPEYIVLETEYDKISEAMFLRDAWERGYADFEWKSEEAERIMPWYFAAVKGDKTYCFGVKTGPNAFCSWQCANGRISLTLDLRNGNGATELNGRELDACTVVSQEYDCGAFEALSDFCTLMCDNPRTAPGQVFGGNDWYCNYGNNSYEKIITHTKRIVECSPEGSKPYMVIDDGWELCHRDDGETCFNGGPWRYCNENFKDMKKLAEEITAMGAIPGIWMRPLWTVEKISDDTILRQDGLKVTLDPSNEKVLRRVSEDIQTIKSWGYKLIKHDFSTFDIAGKWGFEMGLFTADVQFSDKTKTTAEIVKELYKTIRTAAGDDCLIMGCNTIGHLSAGIFDLQRTGDDTSGKEWERTKNYGINTLAFRMPQHKRFYTADADCVGITNAVPWEKNRQWLDVLAKSGTALFVSIAEDAYSEEVKNDLKEAFRKSAANTEPSEPLDWQTTKLPRKWKSRFGEDEYNW